MTLLHLVLWDPHPWGNDVPWLPTTSWGTGLAMWTAASVVSIRVGRRRLWPGGRRSAAALVALVAIDAASLLGAVVAWDHMDYVLDAREQSSNSNEINPAVITYRGRQLCELRVFDADGKRVRGGYVVDVPTGRRLPMTARNC